MPLSKAKQAEYRRERRGRLRGVIPSVIPNEYLTAHIRVYPQGFNPDGTYRRDYNPELDPYINPLMRTVIPTSYLNPATPVIPKYSIGYLYIDGRVRLPDMKVVQPNECEECRIYVQPK